MENDEDLAIAIRNMTLAAEKQMVDKISMVSRVAQLEAQVATLMKERDSLADDNATMTDMIAELESKLSNENEISLLGDDDYKDDKECDDEDKDDKGGNGSSGGKGDDGGDGGGGGNGGGGCGNTDNLLSIPEIKVKYLLKRIEDGKRITIYNCMYIGLYAKDNRYKKAAQFRDRVVAAFHTMCIRYADERDIPSDKHSIPKDFAVVKSRLNDLATLDEREFIRNMFIMIDDNL